MKINTNYNNLKESCLFSKVAKNVNEYSLENKDVKIIRLEIGDVTRPLCNAVIEAMKNAVIEMGYEKTFHSYGPDKGYSFLKDEIKNYYTFK